MSTLDLCGQSPARGGYNPLGCPIAVDVPAERVRTETVRTGRLPLMRSARTQVSTTGCGRLISVGRQRPPGFCPPAADARSRPSPSLLEPEQVAASSRRARNLTCTPLLPVDQPPPLTWNYLPASSGSRWRADGHALLRQQSQARI